MKENLNTEPAGDFRGKLKNIRRHLSVLARTALVVSLSLVLVSGMILGSWKLYQAQRVKKALALIADKPVDLPLLARPVRDYRFTDQHWFIPEYSYYLSPMMWLSPKENCLFSTRLNEMKFAGMVPADWDIDRFKKYFSLQELYGRYEINLWRTTLDSEMLSEMGRKIGNTNRYKWVSLSSMDQLIYLARRNHHVLVGVTIWLAPNKHFPAARRYLNDPISHALTVTGIRSYDKENDRIRFEIDDPLPFSLVNDIPVYSKFHSNGYNMFGRQAVPWLVADGWAKSGYIVPDSKK
ncbi:MAG: hypothetical protein JNM63_16600 [Spirochaetia bacterium]|nr:hypothetical protein [Spirochaetia bacterium]